MHTLIEQAFRTWPAGVAPTVMLKVCDLSRTTVISASGCPRQKLAVGRRRYVGQRVGWGDDEGWGLLSTRRRRAGRG